MGISNRLTFLTEIKSQWINPAKWIICDREGPKFKKEEHTPLSPGQYYRAPHCSWGCRSQWQAGNTPQAPRGMTPHCCAPSQYHATHGINTELAACRVTCSSALGLFRAYFILWHAPKCKKCSVKIVVIDTGTENYTNLLIEVSRSCWLIRQQFIKWLKVGSWCLWRSQSRVLQAAVLTFLWCHQEPVSKLL